MIHQLHQAPSSLRLRLGEASNCQFTQDSAPLAITCRSVPPALLGSSLPPAPPLSSVARALGPTGPRHPTGSLALRLRLLHQCQAAPWSQRPFLFHGSSLRRLHHGPPLWLWPGPAWLLLLQAPPPSCITPWTLSAVPLPDVRPPPEPTPNSLVWFLVFKPCVPLSSLSSIESKRLVLLVFLPALCTLCWEA